MNCKDWEDRLALYVGGDLPLDEAAQVERHLGECLGCQMFSSGLKEGRELLQQFHREPLAPAHFTAVRARVLSELERRRRPFWRRGWVFGLAAVLAAVLVLLAVRPVLRPGPKPPVIAMDHPPVPLGPAPASAQANDSIPATQRSPAEASSRKRRARPKAHPGEPVLIKVVSDDPDVVIYWIADTRGE